jgi:hypothetical protein
MERNRARCAVPMPFRGRLGPSVTQGLKPVNMTGKFVANKGLGLGFPVIMTGFGLFASWRSSILRNSPISKIGKKFD